MLEILDWTMHYSISITNYTFILELRQTEIANDNKCQDNANG